VTDTTINALRRAQFGVTDHSSSWHGDTVGALGLDPQESLHRIIMSRAERGPD
jgi:hypothetical protein